MTKTKELSYIELGHQATNAWEKGQEETIKGNTLGIAACSLAFKTDIDIYNDAKELIGKLGNSAEKSRINHLMIKLFEDILDIPEDKYKETNSNLRRLFKQCLTISVAAFQHDAIGVVTNSKGLTQVTVAGAFLMPTKDEYADSQFIVSTDSAASVNKILTRARAVLGIKNKPVEKAVPSDKEVIANTLKVLQDFALGKVKPDAAQLEELENTLELAYRYIADEMPATPVRRAA